MNVETERKDKENDRMFGLRSFFAFVIFLVDVEVT